VLCLIYHRNFDSVVAIYDSNWYIKRLNNIEIDLKKSYFWVLKLQFAVGGVNPPNTGPQSATPYPCLSCFKPLVTALVKYGTFCVWLKIVKWSTYLLK